jgi:hypothetical protein
MVGSIVGGMKFLGKEGAEASASDLLGEVEKSSECAGRPILLTQRAQRTERGHRVQTKRTESALAQKSDSTTDFSRDFLARQSCNRRNFIEPRTERSDIGQHTKNGKGGKKLKSES